VKKIARHNGEFLSATVFEAVENFPLAVQNSRGKFAKTAGF
jgi:hypothetical protein